MQKNDEIILEITGYSSEGSGIGKYNGMAVFVPSAAAGDTVKVHIVKVKKTYAYGKITEIITPSPDRTENSCPVFSQCGGCVYRHISYKAECKLKYEKVYEAVKRIGGTDILPSPIIPSACPDNYRNKAQYPIAQNGRTGFYAFHSHRIISFDSCALQPAVFSEITDICSSWIKNENISVYNEETGKGLLRHLYIRIAEKTDEIMVCLVINGERLPKAEILTDMLKAALGNCLKSLQININREKTNIILGGKCAVIYGEPHITDILCNIRVRLSPLSFYQVNRASAELLYNKAAEYAAPENKTVLDLYCGAGTIGLSLADRAKRVIGVEVVPQAIEDARFNARLNGIKNAEFICADAKDAAAELESNGLKPDTVIVDPPRKGLTPKLVETIALGFKPERVVYVSCDPATLARDIAVFRENGYALLEYTPVDMFPRTAHVETIVLLQKKNS